jgi:dsDNA-specific endonuclease/ATPase MutS2
LAKAFYGQKTADFLQSSSNYLTKAMEKVKGVVSRATLKALAEAKPGLNKPVETNLKDIERIKKVLGREYKDLVRRHPQLKKEGFLEEEVKQEIIPLTPSKAREIIAKELPKLPSEEWPEESIGESKGGYQFIVKNGKWAPYRGEENGESNP